MTVPGLSRAFGGGRGRLFGHPDAIPAGVKTVEGAGGEVELIAEADDEVPHATTFQTTAGEAWRYLPRDGTARRFLAAGVAAVVFSAVFGANRSSGIGGTSSPIRMVRFCKSSREYGQQ